jgi:hypothetical protein
MDDPGRSLDEAPTSIASPEIAAEYSRRLRLYNLTVAASTLFLMGGVFCAVLVPNLLLRVVGSGVCFVLWLVMMCWPTQFFRCPACDYIFRAGWWCAEPKWHQCPSCRTQFTKERTLRWPNF